jgi:hypothetical protein
MVSTTRGILTQVLTLEPILSTHQYNLPSSCSFDPASDSALSPADRATWLTHAVIDFMPNLVSNTSYYNPATVLLREQVARSWNATFQESEVARVRETVGYPAFQAQFRTWYVKEVQLSVWSNVWSKIIICVQVVVSHE